MKKQKVIIIILSISILLNIIGFGLGLAYTRYIGVSVSHAVSRIPALFNSELGKNDSKDIFQNIPKDEPLKTIDEPLKTIIIQAYPELEKPDISDYEKVGILRHWTSTIIDYSTSPLLLDKRIPGFYNLSVDEIYTLFINNMGGLWCGGSAVFLQKVYQSFGFEAYILSYGTEDAITHAVNLVKIKYNGQEMLTIQDPYFDVAYEYQNGEPVAYFDMLQLLVDRKGDEIYVIEPDPPIMRDYHYEDTEDKSLIKDIMTNRVIFNMEYIIKKYREFIDIFLVNNNLPLNDIYLHLYPYSIYGDKGDELLKNATQITGSPRPLN